MMGDTTLTQQPLKAYLDIYSNTSPTISFSHIHKVFPTDAADLHLSAGLGVWDCPLGEGAGKVRSTSP